MRDRQQYNFLAAAVSQLQRALDADDELPFDFDRLLRELPSIGELIERVDDLEQWVAALDPALDDDQPQERDSPGTEPVRHDESVPHDDVVGVGPGVDRSGRRPVREVTPPRATPRRAPAARGRGRVSRATSSKKK